eukprot:scaffold10739_cov37-Prasinocladus_malaysianus.AAC.1
MLVLGFGSRLNLITLQLVTLLLPHRVICVAHLPIHGTSEVFFGPEPIDRMADRKADTFMTRQGVQSTAHKPDRKIHTSQPQRIAKSAGDAEEIGEVCGAN